MDQRLFRHTGAPADASPAIRQAVLYQLQAEHPNEFICPISLELLTDPVIVSTGHTFERESIEGWFAVGRDTNPVTGLPLPNQNLIPNIALRQAIETYSNRREQVIPLQPFVEEEMHRLIYQDAVEFVQALEAHIGMSAISTELGLDANAAKAYVATIFGLARKRSLGLLLLPNTEETCCIPGFLVPAVASFMMEHGTLMLAKQYPDFCKTSIEVPLNKGEDLLVFMEEPVVESKSSSPGNR